MHSRKKRFLHALLPALFIGSAIGWLVPLGWLMPPRPRAVLPLFRMDSLSLGGDREFFFAPIGPVVATTSLEAGPDGWLHVLQLWDRLTGRLRAKLYRGSEPIAEVVFSTDGMQITASLWDERREEAKKPPMCWDVESGTEAAREESFSAFNPIAKFPANGPTEAYRFSGYKWSDWVYAPTAGKLAWLDLGHSIQVWDDATHSTHLLVATRTGDLSGLSLSPDGRQLSTCRNSGSSVAGPWLDRVLSWFGKPSLPQSNEREVCIFDVLDGSEIVHLPSEGSQKFSPDGTTLAVISSHQAELYDAPFRKPWGQRLAVGLATGLGIFLMLGFAVSPAIRSALAILLQPFPNLRALLRLRSGERARHL